jgi:hypothetical protein
MLAAGACCRCAKRRARQWMRHTIQDPDMMKVVGGLFNSDKMLTWQLQVGLQPFLVHSSQKCWLFGMMTLSLREKQ